MELAWLAALQAMAEFLPISSSSHLHHSGLALTPEALDIISQSLHGISALSIVSFYAGYWPRQVFWRRLRLWFPYVLAATLPVALLGYAMSQGLIPRHPSTLLRGFLHLGLGLLLWAVDFREKARFKDIEDIKSRTRLLLSAALACTQCCALIPGVSRLGLTYTALRALGCGRALSWDLSLLFGSAVMGLVGLHGVTQQSIVLTPMHALGVCLLFPLSWLSLALVRFWTVRFGMAVFAGYRIALGILLISNLTFLG